jgi:hypothetical protein
MDTAFTFSLVLIIFFLLFKTSQIYNQAKSKNNEVIIYLDDKEIYLSDFQTHYLYLTGIKDNFITNRSIFNNIGGKYLLHYKVTPLEFSNNRPNLARVLRFINFFFQPTNFIT